MRWPLQKKEKRKENRQCGFILPEHRKNASDTLGRQDLLPSHQLPVKPSVTVKTGLGRQVTKRWGRLSWHICSHSNNRRHLTYACTSKRSKLCLITRIETLYYVIPHLNLKNTSLEPLYYFNPHLNLKITNTEPLHYFSQYLNFKITRPNALYYFILYLNLKITTLLYPL